MLLSTTTDILSTRFGFTEAVRILKENGFDCVDCGLFKMTKPDNPYCLDGWRDVAEANRKYCDEHGVVVNQSHAPFNFRWKDEETRKNFAMPMVERAIEISGILGVKNCIVHPLHWFEYKGHEEEIYKINIEYYKGLIPVARNAGVRVCIENMWQNEVKRKCIGDDVGSRATELAAYIDELDSEWIGACLDVGHSCLTGEEPYDAIRTLGRDRLKALHIHDNDYTADRHLIPFLGKIEWPLVMQALKDIGYTGVFTFEADNFLVRFPDDYIAKASKFMEQTGRYLLSL